MQDQPIIQGIDLGGSLRGLREQARISQRRLATVSGVSHSTIRDIELGKQTKPRPETLRLLAAGLDKEGKGLLEWSHDELYDWLMMGAGYSTLLGVERLGDPEVDRD